MIPKTSFAIIKVSPPVIQWDNGDVRHVTPVVLKYLKSIHKWEIETNGI